MVKKVGNLNLLVGAALHDKAILVHVDQVCVLSSSDKLVKLDGKEESFPPLPGRSAFSGEKAQSKYEKDKLLVAVAQPLEPAGCVARAAAARAGIFVQQISPADR